MAAPRTPKPLLLALLLPFGIAAAACGEAERADVAGAADPPDQTYTVRGEVMALPRATDAPRQLRVHHEAVPDFVGFEGEVVGMASMTMPFPLASSIDLDGVAVGDKVEMRFEVRWAGSPPLTVVELRELPAGTELDFESGEPMPGEAEVVGTGSAPP